MIVHRNIKTKTFDFEECVLSGWLANTVREPANQNAYLKVQHFCFYVMVVYHFRAEYNFTIPLIIINGFLSGTRFIKS